VLIGCIACLISVPVSAIDLELDEYLQRADAARNRGDWESVASQVAQAVNHPDLPKTGELRSTVHREYGRAMGVLCQYAEAETYLLRAKEVAENSASSTFLVLYELGAISVVQKKFTTAAGYFSQLTSLNARESGTKFSALLVADAYEKYAVALAATGKSDEADARRRDAGKIRETAPKASPGMLTPYGTRCS
jgi:tetratricopeptide (TPR) repeat protein